MTEVAFHFNAPDKLAYACRFARKMLRSEHRLVITAPQPVLDQLDGLLWNMAPQEFVAHGRADSAPQVWDASPVLLLADPQQSSHHEVLLNLGAEVPRGFASFARLIEVVSAGDELDRQQARTRWRDYTQRGYFIVRHDLVLKS
ncbi:DNA polymerase III subunit chi [Simplicispira psychrophila]|uniref:DNA polymerase III subunit chi n=1 Tax=Simplicispira psychrophila TaxID=80882 RepID=UPI0004834FE4|nr:DNA polymerase III subunit chi [Simplicispira psychrophila]